MRKYLIGGLLSLSVICSAKADVLQARIEKGSMHGYVANQHASDSLDCIEWTMWRQKILDEVHDRATAIVWKYHYPVEGTVDFKYDVSREGRISFEITNDHSINLQSVLQSAVATMEYADFLQFPKSSQRQMVTFYGSYGVDRQERRAKAERDVEIVPANYPIATQ